jgi:hypothetical protein
MTDPQTMAPAGVDTTKPNAARMYNYYLGGKDNFAVDRAAAEKVLDIAPETRHLANANRVFLSRAVRFLAERGIRQFLDIGTGLPVARSVHEIASELAPETAVVYVDNDPVVSVHARALLARAPNTAAVEADMRHPADILGSAKVGRLLDLSRPLAVLFAGVLHFITDDDEADRIVSSFRQAMAPGSYLVISHATPASLGTEAKEQGLAVYARTSAPVRLREPGQIAAYFQGLDMVEPGLVNIERWHPHRTVEEAHGAAMLGGVARRP